MFDNSDYPQDSPFFDQNNKKVIGKMKDEAAGIPIIEFVGLRSKMYSYIKENDIEGKTAKGIKKAVIKKNIKFQNYKDVLSNNKQVMHKMKTIRSESHQIGSYEINKISLSCFDDKRYLLENGIDSYAYGHYKINELGQPTDVLHNIGKIKVEDDDDLVEVNLNDSDLKVNNIIVKKPHIFNKWYSFYILKKKTPKMYILDELYTKHSSIYPLTGNARWIYTFEQPSTKVTRTCRVKKSDMFSDYELYDKNKIYQSEILDH